ncbi:Methionine aminopeptidase 2 [Mycena indigotica]|uniref:Methionine aminopeptidase 2 n=1 Tax=Mycena indigotica TaxID=2126181 RepID=A0A8H6SZK1_9AGAR|nr:Methionine aminopeptidase 2 [Mycena indigotica]KAF7307197.1 Methionine aminopeptidase 2 [Mycena indigotica]
MVVLSWPWSVSPSPTHDPQPPALDHFDKPGVVPPSARVEPSLQLAERTPVRLWHLWKYGLVVAAKSVEMVGAVIAHNIYGPRRPSWGIEMTLITSFMRNAGQHSALVDIATIRMAMGLSGLIPLPSDALVTPVTFRVRRRGLRGILADLDAAETGSRELSGEWVVGRRTWQRLQAEWKAAQQQRRTAEPKTERVVLYIHGGAYYLSSAAGQRLISIPLSKYTDARVFALDYRLAPETRFPGPLHDAVSAYMRLIEDLHIPPENIIICGDSAGGGLSLALLLYLRDNKYPLPSSAILMSPWVDLTMSCDSWSSNADYDVVPIPVETNHMHPIALYLGDQIEQYLTHPYASPLFGDFTGLPPLLIQVGDAEVLRDEIALLAHKATLHGVEVRHELYQDCIHIFQIYPFLDASHRAFLSIRHFVRTLLPQLRSAKALCYQTEEGLELEIDTEDATVVRGDGVESETVKEDLDELFERTESEPEEANTAAPSSKYYPSWGSLASPPTTDDDSEEELSFTSRSRTVPSTPTSTIRRIRSAVSIIMPSSSTTRPTLPRHRSSHHRSSSHTHLPALTAFAPMSPPPSPRIRRNSIASHPDITKLVESWTSAGPANETLMFRPNTHESRPP